MYVKKALKKIVSILPKRLQSELRNIYSIIDNMKPVAKRKCNICGYHGYFKGFGKPRRLDAMCTSCGSFERHRLLILAIDNDKIPGFENEEACVLHFAPERILEERFRQTFKNYTTADLFNQADLKLNIEKIDCNDQRFDIIIANHVLEHVSDEKAASELLRILKPGGIFVCQVPINEGIEVSYEDPEIIDPKERLIHFGQTDHVRIYGRDFKKRITDNGFTLLNEIGADMGDCIQYSLLPEEKTFVFHKSM